MIIIEYIRIYVLSGEEWRSLMVANLSGYQTNMVFSSNSIFELSTQTQSEGIFHEHLKSTITISVS
jgi:hypothetical protein